MTKEEIIEMARAAGVNDDGYRFEFNQYKYLEHFAQLVEKHYREKDKKDALAYMRMLHDSFSLASKDKP